VNFIFSHECFPRVHKDVLPYRQSFVEDRLNKLPITEFKQGNYIQVGNPTRADQEYMFIVTEIDTKNSLIYLNWGGVIDTRQKQF